MKLGSTLLHITNDNQFTKKKTHFVKIKFYSNENIEWYCMQLELNLNSNSIQFNFFNLIHIHSIQLEKMICKLMQNLLVIMVLRKSKLKKYINTKKNTFQFLLLWNQLNIFQSRRQLMKPKIVLPRLFSMNHH